MVPEICSLESAQRTDTSRAIPSDDDFSSLGYSYENAESERIIAPPRAGYEPMCSHQLRQSTTVTCDTGSPAGQTLASLKAETLNDPGFAVIVEVVLH